MRRIRALQCDVFVDDLAEVLGHGEMPSTCRKILSAATRKCEFEVVSSWNEVRDAVFRSA